MGKRPVLILLAALAVLGGAAIILAAISGGGPSGVAVAGADGGRGKELIGSYGCGACHTIPGIDSTDKYIGPPLTDFSERRYIAGDVPNDTRNLIRWIVNPQAVEPGTVMPTLGVSRREARDIAAYLYSDP